MANLSIFFNAAALALSRLRGPQKIKLDTIEIDCTTTESHQFNSDVTEFEVESGANISDHRRIHPVEFAITGIISDTPIERNLLLEAAEIGVGLASQAAGAGNTGAIIAQTGLAIAQATRAYLTRDAVISVNAFDKLIKLFESGRESQQVNSFDPTFTIVTRYRTYDHMIMRTLSVPRDRSTGDALVFSATFRQITMVASANAQFFTPAILQDPTPFGQVGTDPAGKKIIDNGSLLYQGSNALSGNGAAKAIDSLEKYLGK